MRRQESGMPGRAAEVDGKDCVVLPDLSFELLTAMQRSALLTGHMDADLMNLVRL